MSDAEWAQRQADIGDEKADIEQRQSERCDDEHRDEVS